MREVLRLYLPQERRNGRFGVWSTTGRKRNARVLKAKRGYLSSLGKYVGKALALERTDVEAVKCPAAAGSLNDDSG